MPYRLSPRDASVLALDTPTAPLHTGGVSVFAPGLGFQDVHDRLAARLHEVPLARRKVVDVPLGAGPRWIDDDDFDLSYHLRHAALPRPGDAAQLGEAISRLIARPLDRDRPLWELYVIEGLEGERTAVFRKVHLAMAGAQHADLFALLLDDAPDAAPPPEPPPWRPEPEPEALELAVEGARERARGAVAAATGLVELATSPRKATAALGSAAGAAAGLAARLARSAPRSPLNMPLTPHRRFATASLALDDLKAIRAACGGTINDVVVAVSADAVGRLLRARGHETKDLDLRAMVPVRVAAPEGAPAERWGEGAVGVLAPLPVMAMDPVARLYRVIGELAGLKESRQAVAADRLALLAGYSPPVLHAMAARIVIGEQRHNVALSNAPGPQRRRWLAGVALESSCAFIPLSGDAGLSIAVSSYLGSVCVGLLGDRRAMPDLDRLTGFYHEAVADLLEAAQDLEAADPVDEPPRHGVVEE